MAARSCPKCVECGAHPVMQGGGGASTRCAGHRLAPGQRCDACEREWQDEAVTRRSAKLIFAPPVAILSGGVLFGLLLPVSIGGAFGAAVMCMLACAAALGAGAGMCRLVDRSARALFLREHAGTLPDRKSVV